jgi:signal transduction histidine kinase
MRGGPRRIIGWWDEDAIQQILHNLLSNALKFGDGKPIDVIVTPDADGAHIIVRDRGVGIPGDERERIFDRGVHAPADQSGGMGVGLWVVRLLAQAHGGGVSVSATPGGGSTFDVRLRPMPPSRDGALAAAQQCLGT